MSDNKPEEIAQTYTRSPHAQATQAGGRAVIYHRQTGHAITLNETGTILWDNLGSPVTQAELENLIRQKWPAVAIDKAQADVEAFVQELLQHQLIVAG
jgi:hypothetical protein